MKKLLIILLIGFLFSCNRDKQPSPFSYWKINGVEYNSNKIDTAVGKKVAGMTCGDLNQRYEMTYYIPYFPSFGEWLIIKQNLTQNPNWVELTFYQEGTIYHISPYENRMLVATRKDNNAEYTMTPTWFINYDNPLDSVLIEGVFLVPL